MKNSLVRLARTALAFTILAGVLSWHVCAQDAAPSGETIRLPDYQVVENPNLAPVETWRYTNVGDFEVLSNASEKNTRKLLADFARFTQAMKLIWPAPGKKLAASTLILCGKEAKFDAFLPATTNQNDGLTNSLFLRNREQVAIVADIEADRVTIDPANIVSTNVTGSVEYEVDHYRLLYREYVRYLLNQSEVRPPVWVEEGLAQIVMDIQISDSSLIYGKIDSLRGLTSGGASADAEENDATASGDAVVGEQPFNIALQNKKLIPLDQFFAITADSPEAQNRLGNNLWAKQAYAFVHFCLFGEKLQYKDAYVTFVQRLAREPLSEALFKDCFKVSYKQMREELGGYIRHTRHKYQKYPMQKGDKLSPDSIELRDASVAEIALIKGDALRLAGKAEPAFVAYRSAYLRKSREPALLAGIGLAEQTLDHPDRARELLEAATQLNAPRPSAYVALARMRFDAAAATSPNGKFNNAQVALVLRPLFEARKQTPMLPDTYQLIADTWARSATPAKVENLGVLDEGIRAFPRESDLVFASAQLYQQAGADQIAGSIARLGLRFSNDAATRAKLEKLLATLPPAPAKS